MRTVRWLVALVSVLLVDPSNSILSRHSSPSSNAESSRGVDIGPLARLWSTRVEVHFNNDPSSTPAWPALYRDSEQSQAAARLESTLSSQLSEAGLEISRQSRDWVVVSITGGRSARNEFTHLVEISVCYPPDADSPCWARRKVLGQSTSTSLDGNLERAARSILEDWLAKRQRYLASLLRED